MNQIKSDNAFRQRAKITKISFTWESIWVMLDGELWAQELGLVLREAQYRHVRELRKDCLTDLCAIFGVTDYEALIGQECYALRCFQFGEIEGIESVKTGKRFTHTAWRRKHFPETLSPLEHKMESLRFARAELFKQISEIDENLLTAYGRYVSWEF